MQIKIMTPKQKQEFYSNIAVDLALSLKREGVANDNCLIGIEKGNGKSFKLNLYDSISDHSKITEQILSDGAIESLHLSQPNEYRFILTLKEDRSGYFGLFCAEQITKDHEQNILNVAFKVFPRHGLPLSQIRRV